MIYSRHLIEETRLQGHTYAVTGAAVTSFTVAVPSKYQTANEFEGYLYTPTQSSATKIIHALVNASTTGTFAGADGSIGFTDPAAGMLLCGHGAETAYLHMWSQFKLSRANGIWTCSAQMGTADNTNVLGSFNCQSVMTSGSNLATLQILCAQTFGLNIGTTLRLFAIVPTATY